MWELVIVALILIAIALFVIPLRLLFLYNYARQLHPNVDDVVLFKNYVTTASYVSRRTFFGIIQIWVVDKEAIRKEKNDWKVFYKETLNHVNRRNREGEREFFGECRFGGKVTFEFSRQFSRLDYIRYIQLMHKMRLKDKFDSVGRMHPNEWERACLTMTMYTGVENLDEEEKKELRSLIFKKSERQVSIGKRIMAPFDHFFLHAYRYEQGIRPKGQDFVFEDDFEYERNQMNSLNKDCQKKLGRRGIYVGGGFHFAEKGNFLTVGGTRSGKGTNLIIPQLLSTEAFEGSTVVIDVKGENAAIAAKHMKAAGKEVYILDPWGIQEQIGADHDISSSRFNPLDFIKEEGINQSDDCKMVAEMLIPNNPNLSEPHFEQRARQLISDYLSHMVTYSKYQNDIDLLKLFEFLNYSIQADNGEDRIGLLAEMACNDSFEGTIKQSANSWKDLLLRGEKEAESILSTAQRDIKIFSSTALRQSVRQSDFDLKRITNGNMVIFICLPVDKLESHYTWLRLVISSIIKTVQRRPNKRVLLLLDEFYSLGYMSLFDKAVAQLPGLNLSLWVIVQNLSQLKQLYKDNWETFISNSAVTTWLGINDNFTADYLSRFMGTKLLKYMPNQSLLTMFQSHQDVAPQVKETSRQSPLEIRQNDGIYCLIQGCDAVKFEKHPYYQHEIFKNRASFNPILKD